MLNFFGVIVAVISAFAAADHDASRVSVHQGPVTRQAAIDVVTKTGMSIRGVVDVDIAIDGRRTVVRLKSRAKVSREDMRAVKAIAGVLDEVDGISRRVVVAVVVVPEIDPKK